MLDFIKGQLESTEKDSIVVESSSIGYRLYMSTKSLAKLGEVGKQVKVYCYLSVKEDGITLFGFADKAERNMFLRLITISGIGPKLAVAVLSGISTEELSFCIANADIKSLSSIKGVGKKTAERIILELRDKIGVELNEFSNMPKKNDSVAEEAVEALISLGFSQKEAQMFVSKVDTAGLTVEDVVYKSLKKDK